MLHVLYNFKRSLYILQQTYLIIDFKSNNSFIYFEKSSSYAAIKHVILAGEKLHSETTETWKYVREYSSLTCK